MDYIVTWREKGSKRRMDRDTAHEAFGLATELIESGMIDVEVSIPTAASAIRGLAIREIYNEMAIRAYERDRLIGRRFDPFD